MNKYPSKVWKSLIWIGAWEDDSIYSKGFSDFKVVWIDVILYEGFFFFFFKEWFVFEEENIDLSEWTAAEYD